MPSLHGRPENIKMHLDYVTPVYAISSMVRNYMDAIEINITNIPQPESYSARSETTSSVIGILPRDPSYTASSTDPASPAAYQCWKLDFDHDPLPINQDVFRTNVFDIELKFCANGFFQQSQSSAGQALDQGTDVTNAAAGATGDVFTVKDWMMKITLTWDM